MNLAFALLSLAALAGVLLAVAQLALLAAHVRQEVPAPTGEPFISILKPLCGVDDDLEANLATFASLAWRRYEVVLGVRDAADPAFPVAVRACARWHGRFRLALQRGSPGLNPKVNQLVTLAAAARGDLVVVSDSNVRVRADYLSEIAARFEDPAVGLVTHPVVGVGERTLGALFDNAYLGAAVAPGMVAALWAAGKPLVVGKSMALRRADLAAMGGFEAMKDVLAEDYVSGRLVVERLRKRVVVAARPVENVTRHRTIADFVRRYARWSTMQRFAVGAPVYASQLLLNPVLFAAAACAVDPRRGLPFLAAVVAAKAMTDVAALRLLRPEPAPALALLSPVKDLLIGLAWAIGLAADEVTWRGHRLKVRPGTRLEPAAPRAVGLEEERRAAG